MSDSVETLKFKIGLSGTYFDKKPSYKVGINNKTISEGIVTAESDELYYIEFTADISENSENTLFVRLDNKTNQDTIIKDGVIINDMLLNVKSIEIDEIDLGSLIWSHSTFKPDHPQKYNNEIIKELKNCVNLGWNGTYTLPFTSPFYIWLLENI